MTMAYQFKAISIRTNNNKEGIEQINEIWKDISSGKIPLLMEENSTALIAKYSNYEEREDGDYDLTIMSVTEDFLNNLDKKVEAGIYKKFDVLGDNVSMCAKQAWRNVWEEQKDNLIVRGFIDDYEISIPCEYAKDNKNHCCLYIAVEKK